MQCVTNLPKRGSTGKEAVLPLQKKHDGRGGVTSQEGVSVLRASFQRQGHAEKLALWGPLTQDRGSIC